MEILTELKELLTGYLSGDIFIQNAKGRRNFKIWRLK